MIYHRFVVCHGNPSPDNEGIFQKAVDVWKSFDGEGSIPAHQLLHKSMTLLNHHLHKPNKVKQHCIFWYKDGSPCIEWTMDMARSLNMLKIKTAYYQTSDPGKVLFEDKHQVMATYSRRVKSTRVHSLNRVG